MSDQNLADKIKENQIINETATRERDQAQAQAQAQAEAQAEADRKQAENEYNDFVKRQAELQKELDELQKIEAQEQQKINELEKQKTQQQQIIFEEQQLKKQHQLNQDIRIGEIDAYFDSEEKYYTDRIQARYDYIHEQEKIDHRFDPQTTLNQIRGSNIVLHELKSKRFVAIDNSNFVFEQGGSIRTLTHSEAKLVDRGITLRTAFQQSAERIEAGRIRAIKNSTQNARSDAILAREANQKTIREFELNRDNVAIKLNEGRARLLSNQTKQTAIKSRPEIKNSQFFRGTENSVIPVGIISKTYDDSIKSLRTFELAQKQQKELELKIRQSSNYQQAVNLRSRYQESNPYVGTANVYLQNGLIKEQSGVLIEKTLNKKFETNSIRSEQANPDLKVFKPTTNPEISLEETGLVKTSSKIPEYIFLDEAGNTKNISQAELFSYASYLVEKTPKLPSKSDKILTQYMYDNEQAILATIQKEQPGAYRILDNFPFETAILNHGTELRAGIMNLNRPEDQQEIYEPTLEAYAFEDLIAGGSSTLFGTSMPEESKAFDYLKEKAQTPEGQATIAGSIVGSVIVAGSYLIVPPLAMAKYSKHFVTPKTLKIAEGIAEKLRMVKPNAETEKMLKQFPDMPESMKNKIRKDSVKQNIVGIEMLDSRTALIKRGTEFDEVQSPYIVVRNSKNARSTIYETYTKDKPGTYKEILISGNQNKELIGGKILKSTKRTVTSSLNQMKGSNLVRTPEEIEKLNLEKMISNTKIKFGDPSKSVNDGRDLLGVYKPQYFLSREEIIVESSIPRLKKYMGTRGETKTIKEKQQSILKHELIHKADPLLTEKAVLQLQHDPTGLTKAMKSGGKYESFTEIKDIKTQKSTYVDSTVSYPGTPENLIKASSTDKLAKVGTSQKVGQEGLIDNPLGVIEKIEGQQVKTGTIILETERLNKIKGFNSEVNKIGKPDDIRIPKGKSETPPKSQYSGPKPINLDIPKSVKPTTQTINPITQRRQTLEKMIKDTVKTSPKSDFKVIGAGASISTSIARSTQNIQTSKPENKQSLVQSQKQITEIKLDIIPNTKTEQTQRSDLINNLETKIRQTQTPILDPKYSLIVTPHQKQTPGLIPRFTLITTQETTTTPIITLITDPIIPKTPGIPPIFDITLPGDNLTKTKTKPKGGKNTKGFFAWNVDTERVGVYLPTKPLKTGRTKKVIQKMDALQKKTHTPRYAKRINKEIRKEYSIKKTSKPNTKQGKARILNISKPTFRNKKEKKRYMKNYEIDFGF